MVKFNPDNKDELTYGECLSPAMEIMNKPEAEKYLADYIKYLEGKLESNVSASQVAKFNVGYYSGYYSSETRSRVEQLFGCVHPVLGKVARNLSPDEIIKIGMQQAQKFL